ncbi:Protodermal factor 1 [Hibiscus syriacus]|uniref:Protodermal factor 1 n=1 Tax=Hibiscus syriacus TaxID=106335 RepID=A0A6A3C6H8_HIBSY|nr:Protodermal factor 1 [Hibiscus syriacus]
MENLAIWILVAGFLYQSLLIPVMSINDFEDQRNFFFHTPDPHTGTVPSHGGSSPTQETPSHGSGGGYDPTPTPSHGSRDGYHPTPIPSHGSRDGYHPTPTPSGGECETPPHESSTPSVPSHSPSHGGYDNYHSPSTPVTENPPVTPGGDPGHPHLGGTCDFWRSHPTLIWGLLGWWGNLGSAFGVTGHPGFGSTMSLPDALSNTRDDGVGALYREGTASFLNSMANRRFPFSTKHVRESFVAALSSNSAAAAQAHLFELANEGHLRPRN